MVYEMKNNWKHCEDCRRTLEKNGWEKLVVCETCGHLKSPPNSLVKILCACIMDGPPEYHMLDKYRKSKSHR